MRIKLIVLSLFISFLLLIPRFGQSDANAAVNVLNADVMEDESNDSITTANEISVNTLVGGNFPDRNDKDWYSFTLKKPGYVSITFYNEFIDTSNHYWKMDLVTADNESFYDWEFVGNSNVKQDTTIVGLDAGTYYIFLEPYSFSDKQYAFKVNYTQADDWEKEFNETMATANPIETNTFVNGTIRVRNEHDWYSFNLPTDGVIWFTFGNEFIDTSNHYWKTTIYDDANTEIYSFEWAGNHQVDVTGTKMGLPAGKYYLLIESYSFSTKPYHFKLNYTKTDSWEKEFNNSIATANKISYNKPVSGLLFDRSDMDWYTLSVPKKGTARIALTHDYIDTSNHYWKISIYDSKDNKLDTTEFVGNTHTASYSKAIDVDSGTYYILVEDYSFSDIEYGLTFEYTTTGSFDDISYDNSDDGKSNQDSNDDDNESKSAKKGTKFTVGDINYKVTGDEEVAVTGIASSSAKNIVIPSSINVNGTEYEVVNILKNAFKKNSKLTSVVINADLEKIGENAFYSCKKLSSLTINGDVDTIGAKAFYNCKTLKVIEINTDTIDKIGSKAFYKIYKKATIKVPSECYSDYSKLLNKSKIPSKVKISKN